MFEIVLFYQSLWDLLWVPILSNFTAPMQTWSKETNVTLAWEGLIWMATSAVGSSIIFSIDSPILYPAPLPGAGEPKWVPLHSVALLSPWEVSSGGGTFCPFPLGMPQSEPDIWLYSPTWRIGYSGRAVSVPSLCWASSFPALSFIHPTLPIPVSRYVSTIFIIASWHHRVLPALPVALRPNINTYWGHAL